MRTSAIAVTLVVVIILGLTVFLAYQRSSINVSPTPYYPVSVIDGLGRNVTIASFPSRIVSLAPSDTQILVALGLGKDIVGVDYYSYQLLQELNMTSVLPPNVTVLPPNVTYPSLNAEAIEVLNPSLVVGDAGIDGGYLSQFQSANLNVIFTRGDLDTNFSGIYQDIYLLGKVFHVEPQAQELVQWMESKVSKYSSNSYVPVAYVICWTPQNDFYTVSKGSFINGIIQSAGGDNLYANLSNPYPEVSGETILAYRPPIIIANCVYNVSYTQNIINSYVTYPHKLYVVGCPLPVSLLNEPGPLSVYGLAMMRAMLNGTAPTFVTDSFLQRLNVTLPVF
jgi:ABC-type Fe3+-hydroxamate transport system, periplasmic component